MDHKLIIECEAIIPAGSTVEKTYKNHLWLLTRRSRRLSVLDLISVQSMQGGRGGLRPLQFTRSTLHPDYLVGQENITSTLSRVSYRTTTESSGATASSGATITWADEAIPPPVREDTVQEPLAQALNIEIARIRERIDEVNEAINRAQPFSIESLQLGVERDTLHRRLAETHRLRNS